MDFLVSLPLKINPMDLSRSKAYRLFCVISPEEKLRFERFLTQPSLTEQGLVAACYHSIQLHAQDIEKGAFTYTHLFATLFSDTKYTPGRLRKILNRLVAAIKNFWYFEEVYAKESEDLPLRQRYLQKLELLRQLLDRDLRKEYRFERSSLYKLLEKNDRDTFSLWVEQQACLIENEYQQRTRPQGARPELEQHEQLGILIFLRNALRVRAARINQHKLTGQDLPPSLPPYLSPFQKELAEDPDCAAYSMYIHLEMDAREQDWRHAMARLERLLPDCSKTTQKEVLELMLSLAVRRLNEGKTDYHLYVWEVYKMLLDRGFLAVEGKIKLPHFINLFQLAVYRQDKEFLMRLQKEMEGAGGPKQDNSTIELANAIALKGKGEWDKAETAFLRVMMGSVFEIEQLMARANLMLVHYEQGRYSWIVDNEFPVSRMNIQRKIKKTKLPVQNIYNFLRLTKRLANFAEAMRHSPVKKARLLRLQRDMQEYEEVLYRHWLLKTIGLLLDQYPKE